MVGFGSMVEKITLAAEAASAIPCGESQNDARGFDAGDALRKPPGPLKGEVVPDAVGFDAGDAPRRVPTLTRRGTRPSTPPSGGWGAYRRGQVGEEGRVAEVVEGGGEDG